MGDSAETTKGKGDTKATKQTLLFGKLPPANEGKVVKSKKGGKQGNAGETSESQATTTETPSETQVEDSGEGNSGSTFKRVTRRDAGRFAD